MKEVRSSTLLTEEVAWLGALVALQMVLGRLTVGSDLIKIGFGFIATGLIGYYFGPFRAAIACVASDIVTNVVFPQPTGFFWGFTLSALVSGVIYGSILYRKKVTILRVAIAVFLIILIVNTLMNTYWISIIAHLPYKVLLVPRVIKEIITLPIQATILYMVLKWVDNSKFKLLN